MEQKFKVGDLVRFKGDSAVNKSPIMTVVKYSLKDPFSPIDFKSLSESPYVICRWYSHPDYKMETFNQEELTAL